ncbi:flavin-binding monooxygenase-like protein [Xylariaceae sp. FL1019]|nr:flavin-binding monooxygenase-like protein [Xylariaceae sp. FL1019]
MQSSIGSCNRIEPGSVNISPAPLPQVDVPSSVDALQVATEFIDNFQKYIDAKDGKGLSDLFWEDGYWRDHLCLSWDFRTLQSPSKISTFLGANISRLVNVKLDTSSIVRAPSVSQLDAFGKSKCIALFIAVTTDVGIGEGVARLIYQDGSWKAATFYTALTGLTGFEERRGHRRPLGASHGGSRKMKNWHEQRISDVNFEDADPQVLILGAGQGGLTSAARLKMLDVSTLIVDRNDRVGDNWRQRYRQLVLHDPVWFDHMPYLNFPDHWPIFTPKDKIADFFEAYVNILELNVWNRTELVSSEWNDADKRWTVTLERRHAGESGRKETRILRPRHIIQATGHSGKKNLPALDGIESFKGSLCHSSEFPGAKAGSQGKRAIVVGSCNSGHDIAQDFYENGYDVTMIQRSSTCVVSSKAISDIFLAPLYAEAGPPVDDADLLLWSNPAALFKTVQQQVTGVGLEHDKALLEGLEKAGFKVDNGIDGSGLFYKYFQRGGGYYIDVGCSQLIIDGKIKVKHLGGQDISGVQSEGLLLADGSVLPADEIVFATGYQNMRTQARILFGDSVADRTQDVWGFDEEGEFRTMWRRSGHPGFWFMGGNLALTRYFSRFLALQIKALEEGLAS